MGVLERFEEKYIPVTESGCWLWIAYIDQSPRGGYGRFALNGRAERAHRVAYELYREKIPKGMTLDHLCRVRSCVNPDHLEIVSMNENRSRGISPSANYARRMYCNAGHSLVGNNAYMRPDGGRRCRKCKLENASRKEAQIAC